MRHRHLTAAAGLALTTGVVAGCGTGGSSTPAETVTVTAAPPPAVESPEPTPEPTSEPEATPSETGGDYEDLQPIDGGQYTWANGVTMDLSIELTQPLGGEEQDLCGDGSCGVLQPEDTTVVVRYDVSVPAGLEGPFDVSSCSLEASTVNGNDDDAITGLYGDYEQPLEGVMLPGTDKFGLDEFVVDEEYAGQDFLLTTACGDPDYYEQAYFVGPLG